MHKTKFSARKKRLSDKTVWTIAAVLICMVVAAFSLSFWWLGAYLPLRAEVDLNTTYQTLTGFGASSAWYWQDMGANASEQTVERAVNLLYGDEGLMLNIFRYNIGGGSADEALDATVPYSNFGFDTFRRAESFFVAENVKAEERDDVAALCAAFGDESNYDFEGRDVAVRYMLEKALATGNVDKVVFFVNSPHYLMTESGTCTGEYVRQNNLKAEFYGAFADYLLIIVHNLYEIYLENLDDVPDVYISPFNEPQWDWGGPYSTQEGCHYDPQNLAAAADVIWRKLEAFNRENGTDFRLDLFECGNYKRYVGDYDYTDYLAALSGYEWFDDMEYISVHDYGADDSEYHRRVFADYLDRHYPNLSVAATEFCEMQPGEFDTIESGIYLAKVVLRDLTMLDATEWSWWLSVAKGTYNDGLVYWNALSPKSDDAELYMLKRYYTYAQFTRYLGAGDVRVKCALSDPMNWTGIDIGAFVKPDGRFVVVVINEGPARRLALKGTERYIGAVTERTQTTAEDNLATESLSFDGTLALADDSVTTFVFGE